MILLNILHPQISSIVEQIPQCLLSDNAILCYKQYPSDPWKSVSMRIPDEKEKLKEIERHPSKSKRLLKALLSRRKTKKDETLYTYLDEY